MTFAVAALVSEPHERLKHVLWTIQAESADEAEAIVMKVALRSGTLVSMLVKKADLQVNAGDE